MGDYSVESKIAWNSMEKGGVEIWTVDGPKLQSIRFIKGLANDDPLFEPEGVVFDEEKKKKLPRFQRHMTANEVMEFVVDSIARQGPADVEASGLRPFDFGGRPGFRFDLTYTYENGLEGRGTAAGCVANDKLYLILYTGIGRHYFPKYAPEVERIVESVRMS